LFALSTSLPLAVAGAFVAGMGQSAALILLTSAAQEQIAADVLGRVMGVISLVHRGAHATGLLMISPLFAVFAPRAIFAGAAFAISAAGIVSATLVHVAQKRRRTVEEAET
jgi:hypothetical protein